MEIDLDIRGANGFNCNSRYGIVPYNMVMASSPIHSLQQTQQIMVLLV